MAIYIFHCFKGFEFKGHPYHSHFQFDFSFSKGEGRAFLGFVSYSDIFYICAKKK